MPQYPKLQYESAVQSNIDSVTIANLSITADEPFSRLLEFCRDDYANSPARPKNSVYRVGDRLTSDMPDLPYWLGQAEFEFQVDKLDQQSRFVSVITMGGHPLTGFRFWTVIAPSGMSRDFTILNSAVEHYSTSGDWFKSNIGIPDYDNGNNGVLRTWEGFLRSIANDVGGTVTSSGDSVHGRWDRSLISELKSMVDWRYSN